MNPQDNRLIALLERIEDTEKIAITAQKMELQSREAKALAIASDRLNEQRLKNNSRSKGFFSNWNHSYADRNIDSSRTTFGVFVGD